MPRPCSAGTLLPEKRKVVLTGLVLQICEGGLVPKRSVYETRARLANASRQARSVPWPARVGFPTLVAVERFVERRPE